LKERRRYDGRTDYADCAAGDGPTMPTTLPPIVPPLAREPAMRRAIHPPRVRGWMLAALIAATAPGCYNADILLHQRSQTSKHSQMEEVDLGEFSVCLPHTLGDATDHIVEFHVFGYVESQRREKIDAALDLRNAELRWRMLIAIRKLEQSDFDEPELTKLRNTVADVINGAVSEQLIRKVGFYHYSFATLD
jgi:hypothetical protein